MALSLAAVLTGYLEFNADTIYLTPTDDITGNDDLAAINLALTNAQTVRLLPGTYYINAPIIIPGSQHRLTGDWWYNAVDSDNYSAGTGNTGGALIVATSTFTGLAAILMENTTDTQYYGVDISGVTVECNEIASGTIYGILVDGAWGASFLRGVCIHRSPADCIRFITDVTSGKIPDAWTVSECKFSASRNGYGVYAAELADSWFTDCEASENALDGWLINYGVQSRWTGCKGENNSGNGWHFTGLGGYQVQFLTACSSHINDKNGFLFDNTGPAGGGTDSTYMLTGCVAQQDGQGSTTAGYAGFQASGCNARVIGTGCIAQLDSTSTYPQYGASEVDVSYGMCFTGSLLQGHTAATHDDGTNTHALVNQSPVTF
jgi:hypothetical protein